ncbi:MAG: dihydrolipoyl dehydrogenase [Gammaproteobacteria bacterium]|nr:dihydrolipoyl dehydrogenase [Gammaproteobacteria bacterium]
MSELKTIQVPDIGDIDSVEVIEVLVKVGDNIQPEDSMITIESDKASMEVPSPAAGTVTALLVEPGQSVSQGSDILVMDVAAAADAAAADAAAADAAAADAAAADQPAESAAVTPEPAGNPGAGPTPGEYPAAGDDAVDLVVIGAGPGGYTAAFRAADLGASVVLIERYPSLGGVCLNVGCIPSKALLHTAQIINEADAMQAHGVSFGKPEIDLDKLRGFKEKVIGQLTGGLVGLSKQRKVTVVHGVAEFASPTAVTVTGTDSSQTINFKHAIIAAGSQSVRLPGFPYDDPRLLDSTSALALQDIPERLLVIGGGIIGLEMGSVYHALGSRVSVVELSEGLMPGADRDLVRPLATRLETQFEAIYLGSKVTEINAESEGLKVTFDGGKAPEHDTFDRVLLAVGRSPNGKKISADKAGVEVDERGFINVDKQQRTNVPHIFAIGDIVGQPMLAHKATHEGKTAAEVVCGMKSYFDARTIPSVAYTDPEVAWMGLTETDAKEQGVAYEKGVFPWAASGRALSIARTEGLTKVLYEPGTHRILGAGITGVNAGELIAEAVLALEMGTDIQDLALTVHPHPTLSETLNFAAEVAEGTVTDIYAPKKKT